MRPVSGHLVTTASPVPDTSPSAATSAAPENSDVDGVALDDVLVADRLLRHFLRRHLAPELLRDLHRLERMIDRLLPIIRQKRKIAADHVVERLGRMALDVLEQQAGDFAADEVGDGGGPRSGSTSAVMRLGSPRASTSPARRRGRSSWRRGRCLASVWQLIAARRAHLDAHLHPSPFLLPTSGRLRTKQPGWGQVY